MTNRVRAFLATSLDGFIAGPNDELDWLPGHAEGGAEDTFTRPRTQASLVSTREIGGGMVQVRYCFTKAEA